MLDTSRVIETAAGGCLGALIRKLGSLTLDQVSQMRGISNNMGWLKEELQILHAVLLDLSNEEDATHQFKLWKNKVRELTYDIEDAIDKFVLTSENKHAQTLQEAEDSNFMDRIVESIRSCTDHIKRLPSDYGITKEIQRLKDRVAVTDDRHKRLKTGGSSDGFSYEAIAIRDVAPYMDAAGLVGIEAPRQGIIRMLAEGNSFSAHRLMVIAIVGFGGLGKTTLAKQVFDSIVGDFQCGAFVPVSLNPDMCKVLGDVLLDFGSGNRRKELQQFDQRQLIQKLRTYIKGKRYLVVIDDIWSKDAGRILKAALFDNGCGSRIIVTTRKNDVAQEFCSCTNGHVYNMEPLDKDSSERLFIQKTFGRKGCPPNLKHVCGKILKKCAGSPLAILTMSGLLANKVTPSQWEEVLCSLSYVVPEESDIDAMRRILSFSYLDLPQNLRTCVLYLSIFPEDMVIKRSRLVNRWIAEGFIHTEYGSSRTTIGVQYFNELISRNLIQPLDIQYDGQARACRVHDTILDFIVSKSVEENFVTLLGARKGVPENKVRRLTIQSVPDAIGLAGLDLSHVRSLTVFVHSEHIPSSVSLLNLSSLRVLDLHDYALPASVAENREHLITADITRLFHLKYLDISAFHGTWFSTDLNRLLTGIVNLQYLETLDLRGTRLSKLPTDIYKLQQLVRLFIPRGVILPDGIGQMKALEELKVISVDRCSSLEFLQELGQLTKLRIISIYIEKDQTIFQQESVLISSLYKLGMGDLHNLSIDMFDNWDNGCAMHCLHESDGHSWQAAIQSLRKFSMKSGYFNKVPDWMGSLNRLEKLVLGVEKIWQKDLDILGNLQSLLYLFLLLVGHTEEGLTFRGSRGFQCLKYLGTHCYTRGLLLTFEAGSLSRLEHLQFDIYTCESNTYGSHNFGIEHLNSLTQVDVTIRYIEQNEDGMGKAAESAIRNEVGKLPNKPILRIEKQALLR